MTPAAKRFRDGFLGAILIGMVCVGVLLGELALLMWATERYGMAVALGLVVVIVAVLFGAGNAIFGSESRAKEGPSA